MPARGILRRRRFVRFVRYGMKHSRARPPGRQITFASLDTLIPSAINPRLHDEANVARIAASIAEWGFTNPVLADAQGVVAGHGRVLAVRQLYTAGHRAPPE